MSLALAWAVVAAAGPQQQALRTCEKTDNSSLTGTSSVASVPTRGPPDDPHLRSQGVCLAVRVQRRCLGSGASPSSGVSCSCSGLLMLIHRLLFITPLSCRWGCRGPAAATAAALLALTALGHLVPALHTAPALLQQPLSNPGRALLQEDSSPLPLTLPQPVPLPPGTAAQACSRPEPELCELCSPTCKQQHLTELLADLEDPTTGLSVASPSSPIVHKPLQLGLGLYGGYRRSRGYGSTYGMYSYGSYGRYSVQGGYGGDYPINENPAGVESQQGTGPAVAFPLSNPTEVPPGNLNRTFTGAYSRCAAAASVRMSLGQSREALCPCRVPQPASTAFGLGPTFLANSSNEQVSTLLTAAAAHRLCTARRSNCRSAGRVERDRHVRLDRHPHQHEPNERAPLL